jgi:hypothetical protein
MVIDQTCDVDDRLHEDDLPSAQPVNFAGRLVEAPLSSTAASATEITAFFHGLPRPAADVSEQNLRQAECTIGPHTRSN